MYGFFWLFPYFSERLFFTLPLHCTHHLQYLDLAVMGPFKTKQAVAQNDMMMANSEKHR
jgi:hypothetical protein